MKSKRRGASRPVSAVPNQIPDGWRPSAFNVGTGGLAIPILGEEFLCGEGEGLLREGFVTTLG